MKRKRVLVDVRFQGGLCLRVFFYWTCCLFTVATMFSGKHLLVGGLDGGDSFLLAIWNQYGKILATSFVILPILLLDLLIVTNRYAGPLARVRQAMSKLASGQEVAPVRLRPNDELGSFASDFNTIAQQLAELRIENDRLSKLIEYQTAVSPDSESVDETVAV